MKTAIIVLMISAGLSVLYAVLCYLPKPNSDQQLYAYRSESIIFILFGILLLLFALVIKLSFSS